MVALAVATFIGWGCLMGASEVVESLRTGVLNNRKKDLTSLQQSSPSSTGPWSASTRRQL